MISLRYERRVNASGLERARSCITRMGVHNDFKTKTLRKGAA